MKKELIKGVSKEKSVVGLSKAKSRGQLVIKKEIPKKTLSKTRSRAVLKDKNDPVSLITDDALDVRHNTKKKGEKEEEHQVNKVDAALKQSAYIVSTSSGPEPSTSESKSPLCKVCLRL